MPPFVKGQSGNPRGRPPSSSEVRDLCRNATPKAIEKLVELVSSPNGSIAIAAAVALYDRGFGKPRAVVGIEHERDESDEDRKRALSRFLQARYPELVERFFEPGFDEKWAAEGEVLPVLPEGERS